MGGLVDSPMNASNRGSNSISVVSDKCSMMSVFRGVFHVVSIVMYVPNRCPKPKKLSSTDIIYNDSCAIGVKYISLSVVSNLHMLTLSTCYYEGGCLISGPPLLLCDVYPLAATVCATLHNVLLPYVCK